MELINEGNDSYTSANGTVNNGDIVTVLMTSSPTAGSTETATLTIGSGTPIISSDYSITAVSPDTIPDSYAFTDVNNAVSNTPYTSNTITVS